MGIHSGAPCTADVRPGNSGIVFIAAGERFSAEPKNVTDTAMRSTRLGPIGMVEHLMSAFGALEITDVEVEVVGPELPILDGSAKEYLCGLKDAGINRLGARKSVHIFSRVNVQGENQERIGISAGTGRWRFDWQRDGHWPGQLSYEAQMPEDYPGEVAPARTFCHEDEIEKIRAAGLGKGGNEENTLVIGADGYLTESRFADEPPRHKLMDIIGDVMLAGIPARFLNVVAERSGHALNVEAAARLVEVCTWEDIS
ncbi:MAG: UDP-3-O-acyl-N-acetylglucosamine deacetylase [Armatimonadota bacterium]|nr:UDP-3-O-acyl-N-acetylglucosamine deacetylase [Armatimonadota bacterium]